jgi:hypothetical protein
MKRASLFSLVGNTLCFHDLHGTLLNPSKLTASFVVEDTLRSLEEAAKADALLNLSCSMELSGDDWVVNGKERGDGKTEETIVASLEW